MSSPNMVKHGVAISSEKAVKILPIQEAGLISVVIPYYNQTHFLSEAIESALAQTYSDREILVMDDGSTDDTTDMVRCHANVRYFHQTNSGLSGAVTRACGVAVAKDAQINGYN